MTLLGMLVGAALLAEAHVLPDQLLKVVMTFAGAILLAGAARSR